MDMKILKLVQVANAYQPLVFGDAGVRVMDPLFTPNQIDVNIAGGPAPSRLFVNQSYAPGWRSNLGGVTTEPQYRNLVVTVPGGAVGRFSVTFSPPGLITGWVIFGLAILASVLFLRTPWGRERLQ